MRSAFLTVGLLMILGMACSGPSAPVAPENPAADLPSWLINVDGSEYEVGPGNLLSDRYAAAAVPGTDMTPDELRIYFGVKIVEANFPQTMWSFVYRNYMVPLIDSQRDEDVVRWVEVIEAYGCDVPDTPPSPIC
jgi:hypothetical protein